MKHSRFAMSVAYSGESIQDSARKQSGFKGLSKSAPLPNGNDHRKMHHLTTDEAFASSLRCMVWKDMS